jgi:hypothetical protein
LASFYLFRFVVHSSLFVNPLILERIVAVNERTLSVPGYFQTRWQERLTRAAPPQWTGQSLNWAGRGGKSTLTIAELLAPAQTSSEMSSALVDAILFHDHVQSLAINCTNTQGVKTIVVRILDRKLTAVHLPWRLCQRQLRTS